MSRIQNQVMVALLLGLPAPAGAPHKAPHETYEVLWAQSPFTVKREVIPDDRPAKNPLEDWALGGVSWVGRKAIVTLFHRHEAYRQMIIDSDDTNTEVRIVEIKQDPDEYRRTQVVISGFGKTATVTYDDKLLSTRSNGKGETAGTKGQVPAPRGTATVGRSRSPG